VDELNLEWQYSQNKVTETKKDLSRLNTAFTGTLLNMFTAPIAIGLFAFSEISILLILTLCITVPLFFKISKKRISLAADTTTEILERKAIEYELEKEQGLLTDIERAILNKEEVIKQVELQIEEINNSTNKLAPTKSKMTVKENEIK
jgi:hypothetical protein